MTEKIYSTQRVANKGDRKVENPLHFISVEEGVKTVYVQDGFPEVTSAYEAAGAKVKPLSALPAPAPTKPTTETKEK